MTLQGQVQAVFAAKAVTSKGSRTALPTLQRAPHRFSWAACDFRSKLGHSCDTPGASTARRLQSSPKGAEHAKLGLFIEPLRKMARSEGSSWPFPCGGLMLMIGYLLVFNGYPLPTANDSWVAASLMARACYVLSRKNLGINTIHEVQINHCYPIG